MLLLYFVAAGLLIGRALGGRLAGIADATIAWWPLAVFGLLAQVVLFAGPVASRIGDAGPALYVASTVAVLVALLRNLTLPGFPVIAAGAALNLCSRSSVTSSRCRGRCRSPTSSRSGTCSSAWAACSSS